MNYARDWIRYQIAWQGGRPLWWVYKLGLRAEQLHDRIIGWGERARP